MATAKNPKAPVGVEQEFNDKDMLHDTLISAKSLSNLYNIFSSEASNKELLDELSPLRMQVSRSQRDLFNLMFEMGWYELEEEPQTKIKKKKTQFTNLKKQLPSDSE